MLWPLLTNALAPIADYPGFCLAVLIFLALPGPGTFALLGSTAQGGLRSGAAATLGIILGDQVLMWLAVAGVAAILMAHPAWFGAVQWLGAAYLGWIGWKLLARRDADAPANVVRIQPGHYARQAFFITLLNPKAIMFYMAFFPLFIQPGAQPELPTFGLMAATISLITAGYCLVLCAFAEALARHLRQHRRLGLWLQRAAGLCLLGFALRLVSH